MANNNFSDFLEDKVLNHVFRNTTYTPASTVYAATFTAAPTDAGGGTESTGGSYARQAITFGASSGGSISNSADLVFAGMPTGTIVAIGIFDALTTGNMLAWHTVTSQALTAGDSYRISAANLVVTLD